MSVVCWWCRLSHCYVWPFYQQGNRCMAWWVVLMLRSVQNLQYNPSQVFFTSFLTLPAVYLMLSLIHFPHLPLKPHLGSWPEHPHARTQLCAVGGASCANPVSEGSLKVKSVLHLWHCYVLVHVTRVASWVSDADAYHQSAIVLCQSDPVRWPPSVEQEPGIAGLSWGM